jgi:hypothetical protein
LPILRKFDLALDADTVLRAQGGEPAVIRARRPFFVEVAEQALATGIPLLRPAVLYRRLAVTRLIHERLVLDGDHVLGGPLIGQHLAPASEVVVAICTVGPELEEQALQVMDSDSPFGLALDGVGSAAVEALAACVCHHFDQVALSQGLKTTIPLSPGMVGWPTTEGQRQIFSLLNAAGIGVKLMPSGMMFPRKSLSLVMGLGANVLDSGSPCDYCSMRDRCRYKSH